MPKLLFCLKRREDYSSILHSAPSMSTGLYNSASFLNDELNSIGFNSNIEVVCDNNDIDAIVTKHRPSIVFIEALWVVPSKFSILQKLHPNVTWVIRIHSEMPFMAGEGMAMDWIADYSTMKNVIIACNAPRMYAEIQEFLRIRNLWDKKTTDRKVIYLPNYYPQTYIYKEFNKEKDTIDISCFGAVRPLKNHLLQAHAALQFADSIGKKLNFHVNAGRIEMKGESVVNNLKGMFEQLSDGEHKLVNHNWVPRDDFLQICSDIDIGMQVSFSETFNIVAADHISQGVPIVGSKEIPWIIGSANPTSVKDMVRNLEIVYHFPQVTTWLNKRSLTHYTNKTMKVWTKYLKSYETQS